MDRKKIRKFKDKSPANDGQALIEFVLGLMIVISFFFFYVKMAAVFAVGNYIHYATFMAARAYSSGADSPDIQVQNAEATLQSLIVGRYKPLIKPVGGSGNIPGASIGPGPYFNEDPGADNWNQGVTYSFQTQISLYPWNKGTPAIPISLTSESWMRREETEVECQAKKAKTQASIQVPGVGAVEWDNGC